MNSDLKNIILHDYFEYADGGGRLSAVLAASTGASLLYGFSAKNHPYFAHYTFEQHASLLSHTSLPLWRQYKLAWAFKNKTALTRNYSSAIYSGNYSPLTVLKNAAKRNLYYCHTPPRFIYDKQEHYLARLPCWQRLLLKQFINFLQPQYESAMDRMDEIVVNSYAVKGRVKRYLQKSAQVVYPPCETQRFSWKGQQQYYLSTARLDSLKQVELGIRAFLAMPDLTLVVSSDGPEATKLRRLAAGASNIHFTGTLSESQLADILGNAIATLYLAKDEDFGMSPVESMAAGKPVVAYAADGPLETILPEETGILLPPESDLQALIKAIRQMTPTRAKAMRTACEHRADVFSKERFLRQMYSIMR